MKHLYDIRDQMPKFSANFFAPYEHQDYPRMMVNKETGKPYKDKANKDVIVQSAEEEAAFWASKTSVPVTEAKAIEIPPEKPPVVQPMAVVAEDASEAPRKKDRAADTTLKLPKDLV